MYIPVTREKLESVRAELDAKGVHLVGDVGTFHYEGVDVKYAYDENASQLYIIVLHKPMWVTADIIEKEISDLFSPKETV